MKALCLYGRLTLTLTINLTVTCNFYSNRITNFSVTLTLALLNQYILVAQLDFKPPLFSKRFLANFLWQKIEKLRNQDLVMTKNKITVWVSVNRCLFAAGHKTQD